MGSWKLHNPMDQQNHPLCVKKEKKERPVSLLSLPSPSSSPCLFLMWTFLLPDWENVFPQIPQ